MTKSELFKLAHEMTKEIVKTYKVNYRTQFSISLKTLYNQRGEAMKNETMKDEIIKICKKDEKLKLWIKRAKRTANKNVNFNNFREYDNFFSTGAVSKIRDILNYDYNVDIWGKMTKEDIKKGAMLLKEVVFEIEI